jgi:DNA polymerase
VNGRERQELYEIARTLRARLEWLRDQGIDGIPPAAPRGAVPPPPRPEVRSPPAAGTPPEPVQVELLPGAAPRAPSPIVRAAPQDLGERRPLAVIREELGECTRCRLHEGRTTIVFGVGNPEAEILFVGEGPGREEDLQGEPFVGAAGKLLNKIIEAMGLCRKEVYIANVVKCRPPNNRDPEPDEVASCSPFLFQQIASIRPKIIVALGRPACAALLGTPLSLPLSRLRGRWMSYREQIPIMPTFHPAYLLRNPAAKRAVWEDMKQVVAEYEKITGKKLAIASGREGRT